MALVAASACAVCGPGAPDAPAHAAAHDVRLPQAIAATREPAGAVAAFYAARSDEPAWVTGEGLTAVGRDVLATLSSADAWGLEPSDYAALPLAALAARRSQDAETDARRLAEVDVGLTRALAEFLTHVHTGRIDPRAIGYDYRFAPKRLGLEVLLEAAAGGDVACIVRGLEPPQPQYRRLIDALAHYRALALGPAVALAPVAAKVAPGDTYASMDALAQHLIRLGDLSPETPRPSTIYEGAVVDAVVRFQVRHGLAGDGVVGRATHAALTMPLAQRVEQIELALERLRWLPVVPAGRVIVANVPEFQLHAFDDPDDDIPRVSMAIVIGRAAVSQTPLFADLMQHVVFQPYWYPPPSIIVQEILPAFARDPGYLEANAMEIVAHDREGEPALPATTENLRRVRLGQYVLRQRPGRGNALGAVKFIFPNSYAVYMHDTPARGLFARPRRDFSHGCIRVADPAALAAFVLRDQPAWTSARIRDAMAGAATIDVSLATPVPVLIYYTTARVREDGAVLFFDDIYGLDASLRAAVADGAPPLLH